MANRLAALAACLGLVLSASPALATQARIDSMGGSSRYITVEDETNIFFFPSLLVRYGNLALVDNLNGNSLVIPGLNTRFGFHYMMGEETVLAIYGGRVNATGRPGTDFRSRFLASENPFIGGSSLGVGFTASQAGGAGGGTTEGMAAQVPTAASDAIGNTDLKMGLIFATKFGPTTRFGAMLNIMGDDADVEQPSNTNQTDQGALLIDAAVGLGLDLVGSELELTLGFQYGTVDDYRDAVVAATGQFNDLVQHWSGEHMGVRLGGRWVIEMTERQRLVPYATLNYGTQDVRHNNLPIGVQQNGSWNAVDFQVGADLRMELFDDVFVVPGLGIRYAQHTLEGAGNVDDDVDRLVSFPFYGMGIDVKVWEWMDFRFGANQFVNFLRHSSTTSPQPGISITNEDRASEVLTTVHTGLGFHFPIAESVLSLDINVNPTFWLNGPDFITGNATNPFGLNAAVKYDW